MVEATRHDVPVVIVQHTYPEGAPVFAVGSPEHALHPEVESRAAGESLSAGNLGESAATGRAAG